MSRRLDSIVPAARPKMMGRAMLSGPSGSGKTWTGLGIATVLAGDDPRGILCVDTERESALTYADSFVFQHLPWRPPYDPTELVETLRAIGDRYAVVMIDSLSHFWRGEGGTLDIADGKIGGWKTARPVQERLVEAILNVPAHILLCVRSKMDYLVENGGRQVTKLGLAPIQDDTLVYELNVAFDIDSEHRITVTKSRTPAVPVGRMYPAGHERKAAADYAAWLEGGTPPAGRADVEAIVATMDGIADKDRRKDVKQAFVHRWGMPQSLTIDKVAEAAAWLDETITEAAAHAKTTAPAAATDDDGNPSLPVD